MTVSLALIGPKHTHPTTLKELSVLIVQILCVCVCVCVCGCVWRGGGTLDKINCSQLINHPTATNDPPNLIIEIFEMLMF